MAAVNVQTVPSDTNDTTQTSLSTTITAPASGSLIVTALAVDKSSGTISAVPTGFTAVGTAYVSSSVSGWMAYKVSDGTETSVQWSWTTSQKASAWVGVWTGVDTSGDPKDQSAQNDSGATAVTSLASGTTGTTTQDNELAIATFMADTYDSVNTGRSYSDSFTELDFSVSATDPSLSNPGLFIATKDLSATGTQSTTYSCSDTGDQMCAYIATFLVTSPQTATPSSDTYNSDGWTDESAGSSNIYTHIDESSYSDSDYIRSAADPSSDAYVTKLTSLTDPSSSSGHTLHARYGKDAAGGDTNSLVIQLRQGYTNEGSPGTLIATALNNSDISSGWTAVDYDLSGAEADSISDYTDLYVRMVANKEAAGSSTATFCCYEKTNSNATATSSLSVNKPTSGSTGPSPANVASGDLLIILCGNDDNTNTAQWNDTTLKPTGFTMINEVGNSTQDAHCAAFYKIADGTEGASFSWSSQSSDNYWAYCVLIKNVDGTTPIPQIGADSVDSTPPLTISAITTTSSEPDCLVFAIAAFDGGDPGGFTWSGTGWSEVDDNLPSSSSSAYASGTWGMYQYSGYGATPAVTATMSGTSDGMVGFMFAIKPGSGGATTRRSQVSWVQLEVPEAAGGDTSVNATKVSLSLTEYAATIAYDVEVSAGVDTYTVTPLQAGVSLDVDISATVDTYTLASYQATIDYDVSIDATVVDKTMTAYAAEVSVGTSVDATVVNLSLTPYAATVDYDVSVDASVAGLTIATHAATTSYDVLLDAGVHSLSITSFKADTSYDITLDATVVPKAITAYAADVAYITQSPPPPRRPMNYLLAR